MPPKSVKGTSPEKVTQKLEQLRELQGTLGYVCLTEIKAI